MVSMMIEFTSNNHQIEMMRVRGLNLKELQGNLGKFREPFRALGTFGNIGHGQTFGLVEQLNPRK